MSKYVRNSIILMMIIGMLNLQGCSIIGFGVGALVDSKKPERSDVSPDKLRSLKKGQELKVYLKDGEVIEGKFEKIRTLPEKSYRNLYANFKNEISHASYLPDYEDSIKIYLGYGQILERKFLGFDYNLSRVNLQHETQLPCYICVGFLNEAVFGKVYLAEIDSVVSHNGCCLRMEDVNTLISSYDLPVKSEIEMIHMSIYRHIPLSQIDHISKKNDRNAKYVGLGIGAAIDVGFIIAAIAVASTMDDMDIFWGN